MAREASITQEQVHAAADALVAAGRKPTNRAVLDALGMGSMATIVKLMQHWKANQTARSQTADDTMDADVSRAIGAMLGRRIAAATEDAHAKVAELQSDLANVIAESERQTLEAETLKAELNALRAQASSQGGQIAQLTADADRLREQLVREAREREAAQLRGMLAGLEQKDKK